MMGNIFTDICLNEVLRGWPSRDPIMCIKGQTRMALEVVGVSSGTSPSVESSNTNAYNTKTKKQAKPFNFHLKPVTLASSGGPKPPNVVGKALCQGGTTKRVSWVGHCVVKYLYNGIYYWYDPSYGVGSYKGLLEMNNSYAGFSSLSNKWNWKPDGKHADMREVR